jgi:hypothetical protein
MDWAFSAHLHGLFGMNVKGMVLHLRSRLGDITNATHFFFSFFQATYRTRLLTSECVYNCLTEEVITPLRRKDS